MKKLLVVVDMVNGFINEGNLSDKNINRITAPIKKKISNAIAHGDMVIAFRDCHEKNDEEFKTYPLHCVKGTHESELIDELLPFKPDMIIIDKNTTNGFKTSDFQQILKENQFSQIDVVGCCSDICVRDFLQSLVKYFTNSKIDTTICVSEDCIDTFNAPNHNADEVNKQVLDEFEKIGIIVERKEDIKKKKLISLKKITDQKHLNLFEAKFETENGLITYEIVSRKEIPEICQPSLKVDAVNVLPYQLVGNEVIVYLIKEYRYPVGDYVYEIPSGLIDEGEDGKASAIRELEEEIGASVVKIHRAETPAYTSVGMSDENIDFYQAEVVLDKKTKLEKSEDIKIVPVTLDELEKLLTSKKFGAQSKLQLRNFLSQQKIQELQNKIDKLERGDL